jgi:signal transduction histidine kinase
VRLGPYRPGTVETSLWRALAVYRVVVLGYAAIVIVRRSGAYENPRLGWLVLAGMVGWTAFCTWAYASPQRRGLPLVLADLGVACATVLATLVVESPANIAEGAPTLPTFWASAAVLAAAIKYGAVGGAVAAVVVTAATLVVAEEPSQTTVANNFLVFLAGTVVGYLARLVLYAEAARARAVEQAATAAERERLARSIHDGVLQVLALVQRRGLEAGGEAAEIGRLAGEQERALRSLVTGRPSIDAAAQDGAGLADPAVDLRQLLSQAVAVRPAATLSAPATAVLLPGHTAREVAAAAVAALDNVARHVGETAPSWVLLEDEGSEVVVTVRDEGPGIPPGRLAEAEGQGRLGVASSIRGRIDDIGGDVVVTSAPGAGTEIEMRVPTANASQ